MSTKKLQILDSIIVTDATLTQAGKAADAKAVGDALNEKNSKCIVNIRPDEMDPYYWVQYSDGTWEKVDPHIEIHRHYVDDFDGGVFGGTVYANEEDQEPEEYLLRNIKVGLTAEDPTTEGEIFFKCK